MTFALYPAAESGPDGAMGRFLLAVVVALVACGGGKGVLTSDCHGLTLGDCRLASGCAPDLCDGCGCDIAFRGCLAASEVPAMCPALGCPSGICCSAAEPCQASTGSCTQPGVTLGCGACNTMPGDCTGDAQCSTHGPHQICEPIQCSCNGAMACAMGCVDDTPCTEGQTCDLAAARCKPRACSAAAPCPGNFDCTSGSCARRTCTSDLDCDGYCVDGACFTQRGSCQQPVP